MFLNIKFSYEKINFLRINYRFFSLCNTIEKLYKQPALILPNVKRPIFPAMLVSSSRKSEKSIIWNVGDATDRHNVSVRLPDPGDLE